MENQPGLEESFSREEEDLWNRFVRERDASARTRLIERYVPFARILAAKLYAGRRVKETEFEDYLHYAVLGLIEAVDKFDPGRNVLFRTFAAHRIQGSVLNNVERLSERDEQLALKGRLRKQRLESLHEGEREGAKTSKLFEEMAEVSRAQDVYSGHELKQLRATIQAIVEVLPERERAVIKYHYFHNLGIEEIADILGLSKGRISQIHRQALRSLRELHAKTTRLNLKL